MFSQKTGLANDKVWDFIRTLKNDLRLSVDKMLKTYSIMCFVRPNFNKEISSFINESLAVFEKSPKETFIEGIYQAALGIKYIPSKSTEYSTPRIEFLDQETITANINRLEQRYNSQHANLRVIFDVNFFPELRNICSVVFKQKNDSVLVDFLKIRFASAQFKATENIPKFSVAESLDTRRDLAFDGQKVTREESINQGDELLDINPDKYIRLSLGFNRDIFFYPASKLSYNFALISICFDGSRLATSSAIIQNPSLLSDSELAIFFKSKFAQDILHCEDKDRDKIDKFLKGDIRNNDL